MIGTRSPTRGAARARRRSKEVGAERQLAWWRLLQGAVACGPPACHGVCVFVCVLTRVGASCVGRPICVCAVLAPLRRVNTYKTTARKEKAKKKTGIRATEGGGGLSKGGRGGLEGFFCPVCHCRRVVCAVLRRRWFFNKTTKANKSKRNRQAAPRSFGAPPPCFRSSLALKITMWPAGHQTHLNCSGHFQGAPRGSLGPQETTKR